jgi:hypothetical protein
LSGRLSVWSLIVAPHVQPIFMRVMMPNVFPFTGRGRADDQSNYSERTAAAVQCSGWLVGTRAAD